VRTLFFALWALIHPCGGIFTDDMLTLAAIATEPKDAELPKANTVLAAGLALLQQRDIISKAPYKIFE
jgi:hypothetical protein